jgi:hypothetical protein
MSELEVNLSSVDLFAVEGNSVPHSLSISGAKKEGAAK